MEGIIQDTLYLHPGRSISEYLDPGLFELHHIPAEGLTAPSFLETGPPAINIEPLYTLQHQGQWVFWLILTGFAMLTMTRYYHYKRLKLLITAVFKRSAAIQLIRERPLHAHQSFVPLFFIYVISFTVMTHQVLDTFTVDYHEGFGKMFVYMQFLGLYLLASLLKIIFIYLISLIFKNQVIGTEYIQTIILYNLVLGIILLPMLLLVSYTYPVIFLYVIAGIVVLMMSMRLLRGIAIGLSDTKYSLYHLFLYLCTLEILPLIFVAKFFSKYFFS